MAEESTAKRRTTKPKTKKPPESASATKSVAAKAQTLEAHPIVESVIGGEPIVEEPLIPRAIDSNQIVTVRNGFQGKLVYISKKTGERFIWDCFGAEQDMELSELKNAKNSNKKYFINNWFMFDEQWIVDYLGINQYYKFAVSIREFDKLFDKTPTELEQIIAKMSDGQKKSVAYRAKQLIADGGIDSNKVITSLEKSLDIELIER